jgi:hypothetical protein
MQTVQNNSRRSHPNPVEAKVIAPQRSQCLGQVIGSQALCDNRFSTNRSTLPPPMQTPVLITKQALGGVRWIDLHRTLDHAVGAPIYHDKNRR